MNEFQIQASPDALWAAEWTLTELGKAAKAGASESVLSLFDASHAALALQSRAEIILLQQRVIAKHGPEASLPTRIDGDSFTIGGTVERYDAEVKAGQIPAGPEELRIAILAVTHATRTMLRTLGPSRGDVPVSWTPPEFQIPGGDVVVPEPPVGKPELAAIPWVVVTVLGVAAIGGASWYAVEAKKSNVSLRQHAMELANQAQMFAESVAAARATGQPIPAVPGPVLRAAHQEATTQWWLAGLGAVAGGLVLYGGYRALSKPEPRRASNPSRRAPSRRASRRRRRRNPSPAPAAPRRPVRRSTSEQAAPAKPSSSKPNPAPKGWGKVYKSERARFLEAQRKKGRSKAQAEAAWRLKSGAAKRAKTPAKGKRRRAANPKRSTARRGSAPRGGSR